MAHFQILANDKKSTISVLSSWNLVKMIASSGKEVIIFTKFHEDRTKFLDFLLPIFEHGPFLLTQTLHHTLIKNVINYQWLLWYSYLLWQVQSKQNCLIIFSLQQSPPSKLQSILLLMSSHWPSSFQFPQQFSLPTDVFKWFGIW